MAIGKPSGLGVLDDAETLGDRLKSIRKSLRNRNRERGIKDALNTLKDVRASLKLSKRDARLLLRKTQSVIDGLAVILPLVEGKKVEKGKGRTKKEK